MTANDSGPQPGPIRVLHLEDNAQDAELVAQALRRGGFSASIVVVQQKAEFEQALNTHRPDIVLADYNLPQWTGTEALAVLQREALDIPLILVSGALGDVTAVECIKKGATDYVLKDGLARLPEAIRRALHEKRLLGLRQQDPKRSWPRKRKPSPAPTPTSSNSPTSPPTTCRNHCAWSPPTPSCSPNAIAVQPRRRRRQIHRLRVRRRFCACKP